MGLEGKEEENGFVMGTWVVVETGFVEEKGENGILNGVGMLVIGCLWRWHGG